MCSVCGCGGTVLVGGLPFDHDEAHRLGLPHSHHNDHDRGSRQAGARPAAVRPGPTGICNPGEHARHYGEGPAGASVPGMSQERIIAVEMAVLAKNDAIAEANRRALGALGVLALNLVSSPGSGKTTLLCRTIPALGDVPLAVIEGDQQTSADAERIRATGARAIQINTGKGCHLDAQMVAAAIGDLRPGPNSILFIENVGNLVCPAAFDLGEEAKVVILSVTEGEDKPLKYPDMFAAARLAVLTKTDLAPHCDADLDRTEANLRRVNPEIEVIRLSARTGEGMERWLAWLRARRAEKAA